jgi:2-dehydro-3-deoxygluconokinase
LPKCGAVADPLPLRPVDDRGHTATSQLRPGDVDWSEILQQEGVRWPHTGGIFRRPLRDNRRRDRGGDAGLPRRRCDRLGDLNYRPSLWQGIAGAKRAVEVNRRLAANVDVMFGNEADFSAALGHEGSGVDESFSSLEAASYAAMMETVVRDYPNLKVVATSLRTMKSATVNDSRGICYADGRTYHSDLLADLEILDRVGGGDSFASGLIYGLQAGLDISEALAYGFAHGALAMTTPGDTSMATLAEVKRLVVGGHMRIQR